MAVLVKRYTTYKNALKELRIDSLNDRRRKLGLVFAKKKSIKNEKVKNMFAKNKSKHLMKTRTSKKFQEQISKTKRFYKSAVPYMTRLLNEENVIKNQFCKY